MGISGCTSCQLGGLEALRAYDQNFQARQNANSRATQKIASPAENPSVSSQEIYENRPIAGAVAGGNINISA